MADMLVGGREFKFELVAPEKIAMSGMEEQVMLPGELGDFMVLAGHTLMLAGLRPGVVSIYHAQNNMTHYFITGGLADIGNQHCTVLTPHVIPVANLYAEKLAHEIVQAETRLQASTEHHAVEHLQADLDLLRLKLDAAQKFNA